MHVVRMPSSFVKNFRRLLFSGPVILGSAPGAGAFFVTYETSKKTFQKLSGKNLTSFNC
jgi:hypothetical protein